ncbi:hypothetical protein LSTR_LSTR012004 [Laodelphax striatellus]|uniref:Uncharacterized protein n=1 Tax=Laodelphax striatellus TaxID=195883 RepID=A0A482X6H7_LAOST|nr:hypothetical protein LSTR_LSTR012004 [Laodelphax striatellus]
MLGLLKGKVKVDLRASLEKNKDAVELLKKENAGLKMVTARLQKELKESAKNIVQAELKLAEYKNAIEKLMNKLRKERDRKKITETKNAEAVPSKVDRKKPNHAASVHRGSAVDKSRTLSRVDDGGSLIHNSLKKKNEIRKNDISKEISSAISQTQDGGPDSFELNNMLILVDENETSEEEMETDQLWYTMV